MMRNFVGALSLLCRMFSVVTPPNKQSFLFFFKCITRQALKAWNIPTTLDNWTNVFLVTFAPPVSFANILISYISSTYFQSLNALLPFQCFSNVFQMFSNVFPMFFQCFSNVFPMFFQCFSNVFPMFFQCFSNVSNVLLCLKECLF